MAEIEDGVILIAEDEPDNQVILQTVVESLVGARSSVVGDGLAVLASVEQERPRVILLDLMMPVLDGFQVAQRLKGDPAKF
jgi:CheY-like chemotaxis protein